jgi:hypothetical protein
MQVFHGSGGGGGNNSKKKKRSVDETRRTTRDPTDLVTKSGHEKKAEQNPFLIPTSDKTHKQTHTSDKTHAQNTAPNLGPQFNPNRR